MNLKVEESKKIAPKIASQKTGFLTLRGTETSPRRPHVRPRANPGQRASSDGWSALKPAPWEAPAMPA
jgi:hypothetical protein